MDYTPFSDWSKRGVWGRPARYKPVRDIIVHHSVTRPVLGTAGAQLVEEIIWQRANTPGDSKFAAVAYSWLVTADGKIHEGRGWTWGSGAERRPKPAVSICFVGQFEPGSRPEVTPITDAMLDAAAAIIREGVAEGHIRTGWRILGHRDRGKTACPGTELYRRLRDIRERVNTAQVIGTTPPAKKVVPAPATPDDPDDKGDARIRALAAVIRESIDIIEAEALGPG